ncbi:AraC family transcriptional regulator [Sediminitomix flava]|uniref:Transcriptional regulator n=1 Tax=Sediminitomix flava TaxID=379075 RepID=A0A315ZBJ1_SEDFL|nr:helix-turn-helix domain-containing protein [Sediminitomix flava]PWJ42945.1 transcriptional regulator [Sediminitomix flava]
MEHVKFNKTICGVDFLLNILDVNAELKLPDSVQTADFFQIIIVKKGNGELILNGKKISLEDNLIVFISANQRYQWNVDLSTFEASFIVFQEDFLNDFFSDNYFTYRLLYFYQTELPLVLKVANSSMEEYLMKLDEIKAELPKPKSDSAHLIRSILYYLLIILNRRYAETYTVTTTISNDNAAYQFRKLVEKHIRVSQRVEEYARQMEVSRITLNKLIKEQFNVTPTAFIKSRLLFELKQDLLYSSKTVDELAEDFSFSEANHLSRFFKNMTGQSPTAFRLAYQNGRN